MAIKSALMTSAYDVLDLPNTNPLVIFRQGAGHVRPNSAADPGLVYDSNVNDWYAFICATQPQGLEASLCDPLWAAGYSKNASDFNTASIAIGNLAGIETITRKVTNVSGKKLTVNSTISGMIGIMTEVSPVSLTLNPGETKSFTVKFTRAAAALNAYTGGYLTWSGDGYAQSAWPFSTSGKTLRESTCGFGRTRTDRPSRSINPYRLTRVRAVPPTFALPTVSAKALNISEGLAYITLAAGAEPAARAAGKA